MASNRHKNTPAALAVPAAGCFVYIGPSILGAIQYGTVYTGTYEQVCKQLAGVIARYPNVEPLIIASDKLASARIEVKTPGTLLYEQFRRANHT